MKAVAAAWPPHRRQALVDQFIAAHPDGWADPGQARMFAARIVDKSIDVLGFPPDRIGPVSVTRLFGEALPATILIPESLLDQAQQVAHAWVRWRTDAQNLPRPAHRQLRRAAQAALTAFPQLCRDRRLNPTIPYVADTPAQRTDGPALTDILHRRGFAVPLPGQRGDGVVDLPKPANGLPAGPTHVDALDAGDPTHRHLITAIGQAAHGTHVQSIPVYAEVVEQLWNDQPTTVCCQECDDYRAIRSTDLVGALSDLIDGPKPKPPPATKRAIAKQRREIRELERQVAQARRRLTELTAEHD